ncbi:MAG: hypothetical protein U0457_20135 [Candidatus Sericytochromatia bacterium]
MKKFFYFLFTISIVINLASKARAEEKLNNKELFENRTHLGINIANFMFQLRASRDINKDLEAGLNVYNGSLSSFNFKQKYCCMGPEHISVGQSVEVDLKQHINRTNYNEEFYQQFYIKYFTGISFLNNYPYYDPNVDGYIGHYYFGSGIGKTFYYNRLGFNIGADVGLNIDTTYNSIAFILFPRLYMGLEGNF